MDRSNGILPPGTGKRRFWRRRPLWWVLSALVLCVFAGVLALHRLLEPVRLAGLLARQVSNSLDAPCELARVTHDGLGVWKLDSLGLGGAGESASEAILQFASIELHSRPLQLLKRRLALDSLVLFEPLVKLTWEDGPLLPAWMSPDTTVAPDEEPGPGIDRLADWGFESSPFNLRVRALRLELRGSQDGRPLSILTPPLSFELELPALVEQDFRDLAAGRLPGSVGARLLSRWNGRWRNPAGFELRPQLPGLAAAGSSGNDSALVTLDGFPRQDFHLDARVLEDTLRVESSFGLTLSQLSLLPAEDRIRLPGRLEFEVEGALPLREERRCARLQLRWRLPGLDAEGDLRAELSTQAGRDTLWQLNLELAHRQALAPLLDLVPARYLPGFPDSPGAGAVPPDPSREPALAGDLRVRAAGTCALDEQFRPRNAECSLNQNLSLHELRLPVYGFRTDSLHCSGELRAELRDGELASTRLAAELTGKGLSFDPASLPESLVLPPAVSSPSIRELNLVLRIDGGGAGDSLDLSSDLTLQDFLETRIDLSLAARLPAPEALAADDFPPRQLPAVLILVSELPIRLDLECGSLPLEGTVEGLAGSMRGGMSIFSGAGGIELELQAVPRALSWKSEQTALALPLHRLGLTLDLRPRQGQPLCPNLRLEPDPLAALEGSFCLPEPGGRLEFDWRGLALGGLTDLLPASGSLALPELRAEGWLDLSGTCRVDQNYLPDSLELDLAIERARVGWAGIEGSGIEGRVRLAWNRDSLRLLGGLDLERLRLEEYDWSWRGLRAEARAALGYDSRPILDLESAGEPAGSGDPPAGLGASLEIAIASAGLSGALDLSSEELLNPAAATARLDLVLDGRGRSLRPWPEVDLAGRMRLAAFVDPLGEDSLRLRGRLQGGLDSLGWAGVLRLHGLRADLLLGQDLLADLDRPQLALSPGPPPVGWPSMRGLQRGLARALFVDETWSSAAGAPREEELQGWNLVCERAAYDEWSVENLAFDLRLAQSRLDCPEFSLEAYGGLLRGAFHLAGIEDPEYALQCAVTGVDSRRFRFGRRGSDTRGGKRHRLDTVLDLEGRGLGLEALEALGGHLRFPELGREVTLNLLWALDQRGVDPSIGRIRRLLELPGFRYRVESLDFELAHGFVRPNVSLRKSPLSPLPDVAVPMSPLPLEFLVRNFALAEEELE